MTATWVKPSTTQAAASSGVAAGRLQGRRKRPRGHLLARRRLGTVATIAALALSLLVVGGGSASASVPGKVKTSGGPLSVRFGPSTAYPKHQYTYANGERIDILCQVRGQKVTGTFGTSDLWDLIDFDAYVSDAYVNTGSDRQVAPSCSAPPPGRDVGYELHPISSMYGATNDYLTSWAEYNTILRFQADGNLVLYKYWNNVGGRQRVCWATGTDGKGGTRLTMHTNGNLIMRRADGSIVWQWFDPETTFVTRGIHLDLHLGYMDMTNGNYEHHWTLGSCR